MNRKNITASLPTLEHRLIKFMGNHKGIAPTGIRSFAGDSEPLLGCGGFAGDCEPLRKINVPGITRVTLTTVAASPVAVSVQIGAHTKRTIPTKTDYSRVAADFSWV